MSRREAMMPHTNKGWNMSQVNQRNIEQIVSSIVGKFGELVGQSDYKLARKAAVAAGLIKGQKGRGSVYLPTKQGLILAGVNESEHTAYLDWKPTKKVSEQDPVVLARKNAKTLNRYVSAMATVAKCRRNAAKRGFDLEAAYNEFKRQESAAAAPVVAQA